MAAERFTWKNCSVIIGDLYIYQLNPGITEDQLEFLVSVELVFGTIIIQENPDLYSLPFLRSVRHAYQVTLRSNPKLFFSVMVGRHSDMPIVVEDCYFLCPFVYPVPKYTGSLDCMSPDLNFNVSGNLSDYSLRDGAYPVSYFARGVFVCLCLCLCLCLYACAYACVFERNTAFSRDLDWHCFLPLSLI